MPVGTGFELEALLAPNLRVLKPELELLKKFIDLLHLSGSISLKTIETNAA